MPGIISRQTSGEPGYDQAQVYIRGIASFGNNNPLVLIDGVERDLNQINAQEVESFTILKDASATAVYGARGANGVILITTKRGVTVNLILLSGRKLLYYRLYVYRNMSMDLNMLL